MIFSILILLVVSLNRLQAVIMLCVVVSQNREWFCVFAGCDHAVCGCESEQRMVCVIAGCDHAVCGCESEQRMVCVTAGCDHAVCGCESE